MGFVVHARLGRGRVVETFSATLQVHGERLGVVVKRPRPAYAQHAALARALTEWGEAQTDVDHPHIVAVLEAGQTKDGAYVIQERVDGVPLYDLLRVLRKKRRTLNPDFALVIATRMAAALEYLSQDGRTGHGALDAGEVLLAYDGDLKVGDQGLYRLTEVVGTDLFDDGGLDEVYWAPEVVAGAVPTPRSDVFTLGLLTLEMTIGHPVWTADSMGVRDAVDAVSDFTHLGQASPALTRDLLAILRPCLDEQPGARPKTAGPVYRMLVELLGRHRIRPDDAALGRFVRAVLPPAEHGEAPTMMVDPAEAERLLESRQHHADWDAASVMIDPEIEARARSAMVEGRVLRGAMSRPPVAPVAPVAPSPGRLNGLRAGALGPSGSVEVVAATVDLEAASPARLREVAAIARRPSPATVTASPRAGLEPARSARSARPEPLPAFPGSPRAPSVLREMAARVPNVAGAAAATHRTVERSRSRMLIGLSAAVFAIVMGLMFVGGDRSFRTIPTIRLRTSSDPDHAQVWVDGDLIGRTPIDIPVPQKRGPYRLRFELRGYRAHEVTIGSREDELRYEAVLRRSD